MALLPVLAVAAIWAVVVIVRARTAVRESRRRRHWDGAMSTLRGWGDADAAGEPWCRLLTEMPRQRHETATGQSSARLEIARSD